MNKDHKDRRYYELGCQAMGEAMEISAKHRRHLDALEAIAEAAKAYIDSDFVTGPFYRVLAEAVNRWRGMDGQSGKVAKGRG